MTIKTILDAHVFYTLICVWRSVAVLHEEFLNGFIRFSTNIYHAALAMRKYVFSEDACIIFMKALQVDRKKSLLYDFFFSTAEIGYQREVNRSFHLFPLEQLGSLMKNPCLFTPIRINITAVRDFSKQTYCLNKEGPLFLPPSLSLYVVNKTWHLCQY